MYFFQNASSNQHQHFNKPQKQMSTSVTSKVQNQKLVQNKQRQIFLPTWLKESISPPKDLSASASSSLSAVREVYTRALGLVECTSSSAPEENKTPDGARSVEWVNTNRVSLLLLRTGVPAGVLAVLWELVNCTKTGQLTRDECAGLLALIALVQVSTYYFDWIYSFSKFDNIGISVIYYLDRICYFFKFDTIGISVKVSYYNI